MRDKNTVGAAFHVFLTVGTAGDKVMQIENDYNKEVYNGDIGTINRVDPEVSEIVVTFDGAQSLMADSTCWCQPTRRPFTRARDLNIPP